MFQAGSVVENKYQVVKMIGQGGMSTVFLAEHERLKMTVILKVIQKAGTARNEIARKNFAMEWGVLKKLSHPGLPIIFDAIDKDDMFILVMEYFQGKTLSQLLGEQGAQPQELVIDWGTQLCDILEYLHSRTPPIIYRDLKPSNIIQRTNGQLALVDFGSAYEYGSYDAVPLGTKFYAAPEQYVVDGQIDARTDIYALGVTLYYLVTGERPTVPPHELKPIRQCNPTLSSDLEQIIKKCTQKDPNQRFQSVQELKYTLTASRCIEESYRWKRICKFLGIWKKELFGSFKRAVKSGTDIAVSHATEDFDMIRYNAELLMQIQSDTEHYEI